MDGVTIEKFYLTHKIERVKELIVYGDLNLSEIAWKLHYSSVAHLSNQFKKFTGLTPTQFKMLKNKSQDSLDDV
jgi:AraC-like DNA-binding protein